MILPRNFRVCGGSFVRRGRRHVPAIPAPARAVPPKQTGTIHIGGDTSTRPAARRAVGPIIGANLSLPCSGMRFVWRPPSRRRHRDSSIRRRAARLLDVDDDAAGAQAGIPRDVRHRHGAYRRHTSRRRSCHSARALGRHRGVLAALLVGCVWLGDALFRASYERSPSSARRRPAVNVVWSGRPIFGC